ncbi:MAG: DUF2752 domain-containing protein [Lachnospiraceae bacterium]|nr:DUF2752 domain-containing protein [Lachnospiraceae bacterium]
MNMKIKEGFLQLKQDIKECYKGILAVIAYIFISNILFGTVCTLVIVTGIPCPACGLTRAGFSLLTLRFADAWNYNCIIFLIVPLLIYWFVCRYLFCCKCRGFKALLVILFICMIVLYVYRMTHYYPNHEPMIYHERNLLHLILPFLKIG